MQEAYGGFMESLMWLYGIIIVILLFIEIALMRFWFKEHATLLQIMSHCLTEIKKKLPENPHR